MTYTTTPYPEQHHGVLVSDPDDGVSAPMPVGDPAKGCFSFTIRDATIEGDDQLSISPPDPQRVFLQGGAVRAGVAVFVVCCKKGQTGTQTIDLEVFDPGSGLRLEETVTLTCGT